MNWQNESNFKIDQIQYEWYGILGMAMAPGKNYQWGMERRSLQKDLQKIKHHYKIDIIVSLLDQQEMNWLQIPNELQECQKMGLTVQNYPIQDMDTPQDIPKFKQLIKKIVDEYLKNGKKVMIHCQGGNGRTGLVVAACFIYQGYTPQEAIKKVRTIRRYAIETTKQQNFVKTLKF